MYQTMNDIKRKRLKVKGVKKWTRQNEKKWERKIDKITCRGEDTTTYGDVTPWLQPGTPLGDFLIEILTGRPPEKKGDNGSSK